MPRSRVLASVRPPAGYTVQGDGTPVKRLSRPLGAPVRLEERRAVTETLLRAMAEGVLVLDADQRVVDTNERWCDLVGLSRDQVLGATPPYPWDADEHSVRRADGALVPVLARRAAVPDNGGYV